LSNAIREFKKLRSRKLREKGMKKLPEIEERLRESGHGKYKKKAAVGLTKKMKPFLSSKEHN
jgi:hypothetical protein